MNNDPLLCATLYWRHLPYELTNERLRVLHFKLALKSFEVIHQEAGIIPVSVCMPDGALRSPLVHYRPNPGYSMNL